jgi:hypothetical protein
MIESFLGIGAEISLLMTLAGGSWPDLREQAALDLKVIVCSGGATGWK